jgi:hypothetical protein
MCQRPSLAARPLPQRFDALTLQLFNFSTLQLFPRYRICFVRSLPRRFGRSSISSSAGTVWKETTTQSPPRPTTGRCHTFGGIEIHRRCHGASGSVTKTFDSQTISGSFCLALLLEIRVDPATLRLDSTTEPLLPIRMSPLPWNDIIR